MTLTSRGAGAAAAAGRTRHARGVSGLMRGGQRGRSDGLESPVTQLTS